MSWHLTCHMSNKMTCYMSFLMEWQISLSPQENLHFVATKFKTFCCWNFNFVLFSLSLKISLMVWTEINQSQYCDLSAEAIQTIVSIYSMHFLYPTYLCYSMHFVICISFISLYHTSIPFILLSKLIDFVFERKSTRMKLDFCEAIDIEIW